MEQNGVVVEAEGRVGTGGGVEGSDEVKESVDKV